MKYKECWVCHRPFTEEEIAQRKKEHGDKIKRVFKDMQKEGKHVGRKRSIDYNLIRNYYDKNPTVTYRELCKHFKISSGTAQRALNSCDPDWEFLNDHRKV